MTLVLGVDPSAKKIALVARETVLNVHRIESYVLYKGTQKQSPESIHAAMEAMWTFLGGIEGLGTRDRFAYVEQPLVGRGGVSTTVKQAYVGGVIRACLIEAGFKVYDVHPSTWRAGLGIKSRTSVAMKADTARVVKFTDPKAFLQVDGDGDLIDAAAIRIYGEEQTRKARVLVSDAGFASGSVQGKRAKSVVR